MIKSVFIVLLLASVSASASAQRLAPASQFSKAATVGGEARVNSQASPRALFALPSASALCDVHQVAQLRKRKFVGAAVMFAGVGVAMLGMRPGQGGSYKYPMLGAAIVGVGGYMRYYGGGYDALWNGTLKAVQVGKTTRAEVVECLGEPRSTSSGTGGDVSTWIGFKPAFFGDGGSGRTASISFRGGVVTDVRRTASQ